MKKPFFAGDKIFHFRLYYPESETYIDKLSKKERPKGAFSRGGATVAFTQDEKTKKFYCGVCVCSIIEQFNKGRGASKAAGRARCVKSSSGKQSELRRPLPIKSFDEILEPNVRHLVDVEWAKMLAVFPSYARELAKRKLILKRVPKQKARVKGEIVSA